MPIPQSDVIGDSDADSSDQQSRKAQRWSIYLLLITVATSISFANILNAPPLLSANDRSRWCTVWALVENKEGVNPYQIDAIDELIEWRTIDKVRHEGHFYSTKPPLLPTLVAGVYWCVNKITGLSLSDDTAETTRVILLIVNLLPMTLALVVLALIVEGRACVHWGKIYIVAAASLATMLTPFLVTLNNHVIAAISIVLSIYPLIRIVSDDDQRARNYMFAGFWAAFACCNELPAALFGMSVFVMLARKDFRRTAFFFVPMALIPLAGHFVTNYIATGGLMPFYAYTGTEKYKYVLDGVPSYWMNPQGLDANPDQGKPVTYFFHCVFGHHGILSLSPIFLLTLASWCGRKRWWNDPLKWLHVMGIGLSICILAFYLVRVSNYNYGGNTAGLRWMFWLIPFWLISMIPLVDAWAHRRGFQWVALGLLAVSVFSATYAINNPWRNPWLLSVMQRFGWIDYSRQPNEPFEPPLWTWFESFPDSTEPNDPEWIEFATPGSDGRMQRLRLTDGGVTEIAGARVRSIQIDRSDSNGQLPDTIVIDEELFNRGRRPTEFLIADGLSSSQRTATLSFLRGIPRARQYNPGRERYLHTPIRNDAFKCQLAATQVYFKPPNSTKTLRYRSDTWICPDVPFGVVKMQFTIFDSDTDAVVWRQTWTAVAAKRPKIVQDPR